MRVVPIVVFSMISGVVADALGPPAGDARHAERCRRCVALTLAVLTLRGLDSLWPLYALAALGAAAAPSIFPARQALIPTLVPREHLPNAISLNTIMFQIASVAGPALGGLLIAPLAWSGHTR